MSVVNSTTDVVSETNFRQMPPGQLAIAGVAIAVISMILEFIALSGFAPSVSGDENVRTWNNRRSDSISSDDQRERKRKRLLKTLQKIRRAEKEDYDYYGEDYDENFSDSLMSPDPLKDLIDYQGPRFESKNVNENVNWPQWNDFVQKMEFNNPNSKNEYLGMNTNLLTKIAERRGGQRPRLVARPIRPILAQRRPPKVLFGVLRKVPPPPQRLDVVYPYGVGGDSLIDRLSMGGNFDGFITAAIGSYVYNRYIASILNLPSINDVLTTLGVGRSFNNPQVLDKIIQMLEQDYNLEKEQKRSASDPSSNSFIELLQSVDQSLINLRDAIRIGTQENSTLVRFMKDFDTALFNLSNTTVVLSGTRIPVKYENEVLNSTDPGSRSKRSTGQARQNVVMNFMKVVDDSLLEVREFLDQTDKMNETVEDNTVVLLMKAVDKGLVKIRQSFVNDTDTENTEPAISSLSNIINHGMEMVDHVLNQTTVFSVGNEVTSVLKIADQEAQDLKDFYFHNDTGQLDLPNAEESDSSVVTIMKLADQELLDIVKYFTETNVTNFDNITDESPEDGENNVVKVVELGNEQLKDIVEYWQGTTTVKPTVRSTEISTESSTESSVSAQEESAFLQFMKRVDRELNQAQKFLYNVTDNIIGTKKAEEKVEVLVETPESNTNTRFSPIPIQNNNNAVNNAAKDKVDYLSSGLIFGSVISGLAMGGILGLIELITNTGGLMRRSDTFFPFLHRRRTTKPRKKKRKISPKKKKKPISLLQDLKDYDDYYYNYDYPDYYYYSERNYTSVRYTTSTEAPRRYQYPSTEPPRYHYTTTQRYQYPATTPAPVYHTSYPATPAPYTSYPTYPSPTYQNPRYPSTYNQYPNYQQPSSGYGNYQYQGYQYSQYQGYPSGSISKKVGMIDQGKYPANQHYPQQVNTLRFPDIYNRKYEYQSYSKPPTKDDTKKDNNQYIYLDQEEVEKLDFDFDFKDDDYKIMPFEYKPVEYDNYDMDEYGNLDFTQPDKFAMTKTSTAQPKTSTTQVPKKVKKRRKKKPRRKVLSHRYGISYGAPVRIRPQRFRRRFRRPIKTIHRGKIVRNKKRRLSNEQFEGAKKSHRYLNTLKSSFDFNGLVALAGLWVVWNSFLVSLVPNTFLLDFVNNVGGGGRSMKEDEFEQIVQMLKRHGEKL